jgi:hypothetical protein
MQKNLKTLVLILLVAGLLLSPVILSAKAATQDTVNVLSAVGGTTDPTTGASQHDDGSSFTIQATAGSGFNFLFWNVVTAAGATTYTDNPLTITLNASDYAIEPVFQGITYIPPASTTTSSTNAIVVVLSSVGGTTTPKAGTYALADASQLKLTATPSSGFKFDHWVIGGSPLSHGAYSFTATPTDNPYTVDHGYGNTYSYQAVFSPTNAVPEFSSIATIALALVLVAIAFGTYAYKRKTK